MQACAVERHMDMSQEPSYARIYRGKCRAPDGSKTRAAGFVRVCAVEMTGKRAGRQSEHLDQAPPFTPTVRTPQCGHAVWGKTVYNCTSYCSSYIFTVST